MTGLSLILLVISLLLISLSQAFGQRAHRDTTAVMPLAIRPAFFEFTRQYRPMTTRLPDFPLVGHRRREVSKNTVRR